MNQKFNFYEIVTAKDIENTRNIGIANISGVICGISICEDEHLYSVIFEIDGFEETFRLRECELLATGEMDKRNAFRKFSFYDKVSIKESKNTAKECINGKIGVVIGMAPDDKTWHYVIEILEMEENFGVIQEDLILIKKHTTTNE